MTAIPPGITKLANLEKLMLDTDSDSKITVPPRDVCAKGLKEIMDYLTQVAEGSWFIFLYFLYFLYFFLYFVLYKFFIYKKLHNF